MMEKERTYVAIDLKSFYASVECKERNRDPLTTNLVVADKSRTEKTICLAVSPALKCYGIPGRARLFEVESVEEQYSRDLAEWERQTSRKPSAAAKEQRRPPEKQSVLKHLREIQDKNRQKPPQRQRKKSIDRDSR